jgi:phage repressor protein C with HTH and peptisase S24 domain
MDDLFPTNLPATALQSRRLRLVEVIGDGMEPTLRPRDYAFCKPVHAYGGEGIYLLTDALGGEIFYRVDITLGTRAGAMARLMLDNQHYMGRMIPLEEFDARVLAIVVADVRVRSHRLLQEAMSSHQAQT